MTVTEFATVFRFDPDVVYRWLKAGTVPGYKFGDSWRLSRSDVLARGLPAAPVKRPRKVVKLAGERPGAKEPRRPGPRPKQHKPGSAKAALRALDPYADLRS